jgi:hypothetical protein
MSSDRAGDTKGGLPLTLVESSVSDVCAADWIVISLFLSYCLLLGLAYAGVVQPGIRVPELGIVLRSSDCLSMS